MGISETHRKNLSLSHKGKPTRGNTEILEKEEVLRRGRIASNRYHNSQKGKFSYYKKNARIYNREFTLTFKEFEEIVTSPCSYCNLKGFGIDRIDSSKGYFLDNCIPCCTMCNRMKSDFKIDNFVNQCKLIANNINK